MSADFVSKDITAICAMWVGERNPSVWLLGQDSQEAMLQGFRSMYDEADMVCGHNILKYDLPFVNAMMVEYGLPALSNKLAHDTYLHLLKKQGVSMSQASLAGMLGLESEKVGMDQTRWRAANRLEAKGLKATRERVVGDVIQNIELRKRLMELGYLGPPRMWYSGVAPRKAA